MCALHPPARTLLTCHHAGIGLQAAQIISDAEEPLAILKQLSQNFPKYATSLARQVTVDTELEEEMENNQVVVRGGLNVAWLNGVQLTEKDMNPFAYVPARIPPGLVLVLMLMVCVL